MKQRPNQNSSATRKWVMTHQLRNAGLKNWQEIAATWVSEDCVLDGWCVAEWAVTSGYGTAQALSEWNTTVNGIMWTTCVHQNGCCLKGALFSHVATHSANVSAADKGLCFHQLIFSSANRDLLVTFVLKKKKSIISNLPKMNLLKSNLEKVEYLSENCVTYLRLHWHLRGHQTHVKNLP